MNSDALFGMSLGLQAPWEITDVTFKQTMQQDVNCTCELGLLLAANSKTKQVLIALYTTQLSVSGSTLTSLNTIVSYIAKYRASPPVKVRCEQSMYRGHGHKVASRFYSRHLLGLIEREMPVIRVAQILGVHPQRIWTVFDQWVGKARANGSQLNQASWRRRGIE